MVETIYSIPGAPFLAVLSDLHGQSWQEVVNSLQKMKPEIIAIAGDICRGAWPEDGISPLVSEPDVLPFLEHCASVAPAFLALGNHERHLDEADLASIRNTGVTLLDNEFTVLPGREIVIGGLTSGFCMDIRKLRRSLQGNRKRYPDYHGYESDHQPDPAWLSDFAAAPGYHILISHHPEYYSLVPENVRLILSGHTHGGQWRFFGRGIYAPGQGWFPKYSRGLYGGRLVVSAGLANTYWVPRLFNPTEIVYINPC